MDPSSTTYMSKIFLFSLLGVHDGNPLTNYYQLSLDVLALCLFNGSYSITEVTKRFTPEDKNFSFGGRFSVGESLNPIPLVERTWLAVALALGFFPARKHLDFFSSLSTLVSSEENFLFEKTGYCMAVKSLSTCVRPGS